MLRIRISSGWSRASGASSRQSTSGPPYCRMTIAAPSPFSIIWIPIPHPSPTGQSDLGFQRLEGILNVLGQRTLAILRQPGIDGEARGAHRGHCDEPQSLAARLAGPQFAQGLVE